MTRTRIARVLPALLACVGLAAAQARAVKEQAPTAGAEQIQALQRDSFTYVAVGRRDPFVPALPPPSEAASTPLAAEVLGIIVHTDSVRSVVVVRVGRPAPVGGFPPPDAGRVGVGIHRLRLGERIGGMRILSIHEHQVVVEVEGPGGVERRLLALRRPRGGAR